MVVLYHKSRLDHIVSFGREPHYDPDFRWWKYLLRSVFVSLVAGLLLWTVMHILVGDLKQHPHELRDLPSLYDLR